MLEQIKKANDIKKINKRYHETLAKEIREFLIESISQTGGHLASNLGVVELTMALHLSFELPKDKIIWDVGHQAYTHKLLTGRKEQFNTLRNYKGLSGFPKTSESDCDVFNTGHSSTAISAGLGMARARDFKNEDAHVVSVIGDGSLTGGMAYEALNNAGDLNTNFIIVLNDNRMSISENVGGMNNFLRNLRTSRYYKDLKTNVSSGLQKVPVVGQPLENAISSFKSSVKQLFVHDMFFEEMGITYLGPVNGHNIEQLRRVFYDAKKVKGAVVVHVITKKGRGYSLAEKNPAKYHGIEPFDIETGERIDQNQAALALNKKTYTEVFGETMCKMARKHPDVVAITAAMKEGTGLHDFAERFPKRFFDVGIAEEHAVTFAAGLAANKIRPVVAIYSSFLQRAYDQILHDVCLQKLPVIFAIDRAGLVGADGETHQGIFDISFLSTIPHITIMAPSSGRELEKAFEFAYALEKPVAIRYPRSCTTYDIEEICPGFEHGKAVIVKETQGKILLMGLGSMVQRSLKIADILEESGITADVANLRFAKPFDEEFICAASKKYEQIYILEENVVHGSLGEKIAVLLLQEHFKGLFHAFTLPDDYIEQGTKHELLVQLGLTSSQIAKSILENQ